MRLGAGWLIRRLGSAVLLLFLLTLITFGIWRLIPANPAGFIIDLQRANSAQIAKADHELGVDQPFWVAYGKYVRRLLHGDLGISYNGIQFSPSGQASGVHVGRELVRSAAVTGSVALGGAVLLLLIAMPLGVLAAKRARTWIDRTILVVALVGISTHPIVVGLVLRTLVGVRWHIVPDSGYCSLLPQHGPPAFSSTTGAQPACSGPAAWATHLILPWTTFALFFIALYIRMIRTRVLETLGEPYVRTARAKGAGELRVIRKHVLRNAILPILTMLGLELGTAVGIALYVETVYGLPGLGRQSLQALSGFNGYDLPVILGIVLLVGTVIIVLNLLLDLIYAALDPTIRERGRPPRGAFAKLM